MYYKNRSYRLFYKFLLAFMIITSLACILPMIHILSVSFSGRAATSGNLVTFWPKDFTLDAYKKTFSNNIFLHSMLISVIRSVLGVGLGMVLTVMTAYPLSKDKSYFKSRGVYTWFLVITMLFSGGLIPTYIVVVKLHLLNSIWALVLPGLVGVFNILLMLNFYKGIPRELEEAALIDGASQMQTLVRIYLPVSLPAITTLSLFTLVGHWNSWFDGLIYASSHSNWPMATLLQSIIVALDFASMGSNPFALGDVSDRTVKAAQIFIGALPVLLVYPFLQKFFVKGVVLGAVKE